MNSVSLSFHPTASQALALAILRDLHARGVDVLLTLSGGLDEALARAQAGDALVCLITPGGVAVLKPDSRQFRELEQAAALGQPVLGLFAYGAAPSDASLSVLPVPLRDVLRANPVVMPPLTEPDALETGLDYLNGQLTTLFEQSVSEHGHERAVSSLGDVQRALRRPAPNERVLMAEAWINRALTSPNPAARLDAFDHALALDDTRTDAYMERGVLRLRAGDAAGARDDLDAAAPDYHDPRFFVLRGQARRALGELQDAATDFSQAIERDPAQASAWSGRALCRKSLGDYAGALADFERALALGPPTAALFINRGLVRKALAQDGPTEDLTRQLEAARDDYDFALQLEPGSAIALNNRGVVRLQLGDVTGAMADFDAALERAPEYASAQRNRAAAQEAVHRAATSENRAAAETHISLALALAHGGLMESALNELAEAIQLDSSSASAFHTRARLRAALGDSDGAFEDFAQSVTLDPTNALAYADRAELHLSLGQVDQAARDYTRAIRQAPGSAYYLLRRGMIRAEAGDPERAIDDFDASLQRNSQSAATWYHRGLAYAANRQFSAAIADYNAALSLDPELVEAYLNRGLARAAEHDPDSRRAAIEDLQLYLVQSSGEDRAEVERILRVLERQH